MRDLALQVGEAYPVEIDHPDGTHTGRGEIKDQRAAEPSCSNDQNASAQKLGLAGPAHLAQDDVPGIAFQLFIIEGGPWPRGHLTHGILLPRLTTVRNPLRLSQLTLG